MTQKQITYSKFIPRLFATSIDLLILTIVLTPLMAIITKYIFIYSFGDFFINSGIDINDSESMNLAISSPEFAQYLTLGAFLKYTAKLMLVNSFFMSFYFIGFWHYFGATPGKMIMHMKIVDSSDYSRPSLWRLIKRFFYYVTAFVGIWSIVVTKRSQALHDKMAGTVVVKR